MEIQQYAPYEEQLFNQARKAYQIKMVRGYAHELNNILTGILGYSQLLLTMEDSEDTDQEQLSDIESSAQRSRLTIRQMSRLWRSYESLPIMLDVKSTISSMISSLKFHCERRSIQITQEFLGSDLFITVKEDEFEDAFYSLFIALISEGPDHLQLQLIVERVGDDLLFTLELTEFSRIADILISAWSDALTLQELSKNNIHIWVFVRLLHAMNGDIQRHGDLRSAVVLHIPVK